MRIPGSIYSSTTRTLYTFLNICYKVIPELINKFEVKHAFFLKLEHTLTRAHSMDSSSAITLFYCFEQK